MNQARMKQEVFPKHLERYHDLFNRISSVLEVNGFKYNEYRDDLYMCIDIRKSTPEKLHNLISIEAEKVFGELGEKRFKIYISNSKKKATVLFKQ